MHRMHRMHPLLLTFDHFWRPLFDAFLRTVSEDGQKTITKVRSKMREMSNSLAFWTPPLTGCARLRLGQAQERRA